MTTTTNHIPQLESGNFENWLFRIEMALDEKGIKETVKIKTEDATSKHDAKARNIIIQGVPDKYLEYIKGATTAYEMVEKLKAVFQRRSTLSTLTLRRELINLKCRKEENVQEFLNKFEKLIQDIEASGTQIDEKEKVCQLLLSVEKAYQTLVTALEMSNIELTVEFIKSKLLDAELKEKRNHTAFNQPKGEYVFHSSSVKCYSCGGLNHFARNCPKKNGNYVHQPTSNNYRGRGNFRARGARGARGAANIGERHSNSNAISFVAAQAVTADTEAHREEIQLVIDSGSTYHLINKRYEEYMTNIKQISQIHIRAANGGIMTATYKGNLTGMSEEGYEVTIEDCLIIDNLSHNLLSVLKLNEKGLQVIFDKETALIKKGNIKIQGDCNGKLFTMKLNLNRTHALVSGEDNLWHRRMGHLNYGGMKILGLALSKEKCTICMEAKASRCVFNENPVPRTERIGQLVYCDIGGPVTPVTQNGERYYLTIIDDYSHFMELHPLSAKSEAKDYIMKYINIMKNNGNNVRRIRTDRGGEFLNDDLSSFYAEHGIIQETTCAYTPQQNSICERMNLTLGNKVRAMLLETNLPKYLWGEAMRCAAYTINRSPTKALRGDTPAKIWYGNNNLDKVRVFGAKAWSMIFPRPNKLEPRAKPMRMIGYCGSGYRLWDPKTNEIIESRDVRFDESNYRYRESEMATQPVIYDEDEEKEPSKSNDSKPDMTNMDMTNTDMTNTENTEEQAEDTETSQEQEQRPNREVKLPKKYDDFDMTNIAYALLSEDPVSYEEAIQKEGWSDAINKELQAHNKLRTWQECDLPKGHKAIDTKWVFRTKADNTKKARLVAKGFQEETTQNVYAPVARITTVRLFLNKAVQENLHIKQLDIPTAFLNGELNTDIYIKYPEGVQNKQEGRVLKLNKALYGLKEAPRCWNEKLNRFLTDNELKQSQSDFCLYTGTNVYILIFVDDILVIGDGKNIVQKLKEEFQAKDMGTISKFLGMEISQFKNKMEIKQTQIIEKILLKFKMQDCKGCNTPMEVGLKINENEEVMNDIPYREVIGSLMYLATISRPDIAYATGFLSRYMTRPTPTLWTAAKRVLRYLKQTKEKGLVYRREDNNNLLAFSDSDWGSEQIDRKSVSGVAIFHQGNLVSWSSKKQSSVSLSTAESEYYAAALSVSETVFIREVLKDLHCDKNLVCSLFIDNQSTIKMIESYENSKRSKHIDIKAHFIKDIVNKGLITLKYVCSSENKADILTKSLCQVKHNSFCESLGLY